eukprot:747232-Hanusia_phi.AAC.6
MHPQQSGSFDSTEGHGGVDLEEDMNPIRGGRGSFVAFEGVAASLTRSCPREIEFHPTPMTVSDYLTR